MVSQKLSGYKGKSCVKFLGAFENENVGDCSLRRYGWKDLMREKQTFMGELHKMKIFLYCLITTADS